MKTILFATRFIITVPIGFKGSKYDSGSIKHNGVCAIDNGKSAERGENKGINVEVFPHDGENLKIRRHVMYESYKNFIKNTSYAKNIFVLCGYEEVSYFPNGFDNPAQATLILLSGFHGCCAYITLFSGKQFKEDLPVYLSTLSTLRLATPEEIKKEISANKYVILKHFSSWGSNMKGIKTSKKGQKLTIKYSEDEQNEQEKIIIGSFLSQEKKLAEQLENILYDSYLAGVSPFIPDGQDIYNELGICINKKTDFHKYCTPEGIELEKDNHGNPIIVLCFTTQWNANDACIVRILGNLNTGRFEFV